MSQYSNVIEQSFGSPQPSAAEVVGTLDDNPDEAARAVELSSATGIPPSTIFGDLENFDRNYRAQLAGGIVQSNHFIADYVAGNAMASRVSNDDYGQLDAVSQGLQRFMATSPISLALKAGLGDRNLVGAAWEGFKEGFGEEPLGSFVFKGQGGEEAVRNHRMLAAIALTAGIPIETVFRGVSGVVHGAAVASGAIAENLGASQGEAGRLSRDVVAIANVWMPEFARITGMHTVRELNRQLLDSVRAADPYISAGHEPPVGLNAVFDQAKVEQNKMDLEALNNAIKEAQASATRERAPEIFASFIRQHTDAQIGISAEAVAKLYGDKVPLADDGLLGWAPRIKEQIEAAIATGADVEVPLADWLAKVDPKVAKDLADDIRVRPGGVTKTEAALLEPKEVIAEPVPGIRGAAGLEPLFSYGDRKLKLQRLEETGPKGVPLLSDIHRFDILDDRGEFVANLSIIEQKKGKELYVEFIGQETGGPVNLGPALVRDLLRQVKAEFPEAETLTGYRVTGARAAAGKEMEMPPAKISLMEGWDYVDNTNEFFRDLTGAKEVQVGAEHRGFFKDPADLSPQDKAIVDAVEAELDRLTPKQLEFREAERLETAEGVPVRGVYARYRDRLPVIFWSLERAQGTPAGGLRIARHEAIHHLRQQGFFTKDEWDILTHAAREGDWEKKHSIDVRYEGLKREEKLEEAIAEEYRTWAETRDTSSAIGKIFARLRELLERVGAKIKELIGEEASAADLFRAVERGEVGRREGNAPLHPEAFRSKEQREGPAQGELPGVTRLEDRDPFARASAVGMTVDQYNRYLKLIEKRNAEDAERFMKRAMDKQKREQTAEWKAEAAELRKEVADEMLNRPDIAADRLLSEGVLYGDRLDTKPRLSTEFLTEEQQALLPRNYYAKNGLHPDDVAGLFGYPSGQAMVEGVIAFVEGRKQSGRRPEEYVRRLIADETERRMQQRHGDLAENILEAAKEQVLSQTQLDLLHEEVLALGLKAGTEFSITKAQLASWVEEKFMEMPASGVSSDKLLAAAGRSGRAAELALLQGKPLDAFRAKQQQYLAVSMAKEAKAFEKEKASFERLAKRYSEPLVKNVDRAYMDFTQYLLTLGGVPVKRVPAELADSMARSGHDSLASFLQSSWNDGWEPDVAGYISAERVKQLDQMTVQEQKEFMAAAQSMAFIGRQVHKIELAGKAQDFAEFKEEVIDNIRTLPKRDPRKPRLPYMIDATLVRMEELMKDLDLREASGPLWNAVIRPMAEAKHTEYSMLEDLSKLLKTIKGEFGRKWQKTLDDTIINDVMLDPENGIPFEMTRSDMINIMLNFGNRSNIQKFTRAWGSPELGRFATKEEAFAFEQRLRDMFEANATKEDWDFVQNIWDIWKSWQPQAAKLYYDVSGRPVKWIEAVPIQTKHGEYAGGYYPIIYDETRSKIGTMRARTDPDALFGGNFKRATPANHYTRDRTGFVDFIEFQDPTEAIASRMQQMIHDISYRRAVIDVSKVINDHEIRGAIRRHYGKEYEDQLKPWLRDIANHFNQDEEALKNWMKWLRRIRMNLIGHTLPFNLKVIGSPDVGLFNPLDIQATLADRKANVALAYKHSKEIPHTFRNMDRDFRERLERLINEKGLDAYTADAVRAGFYPVVKFSQGFRITTFVTEFKKNIAKGMSEGEAAATADSVVRERHGSGGLPDLPAIMRSGEGVKMMTTFYGYFNTMYNWQRQIPGQIRRGEHGLEGWSGTLYGSVLIGAAFGAALFNRPEKDEGWFKTIAKALSLQVLGTLPAAREMATLFVEGYPPRTPFGSLLQAIKSGASDVKKAVQKKKVEKPIQHAANVIGLSTGFPLAQLGRTGQFAYDVQAGKQRPKSFMDWYRGVIHGEFKPR